MIAASISLITSPLATPSMPTRKTREPREQSLICQPGAVRARARIEAVCAGLGGPDDLVTRRRRHDYRAGVAGARIDGIVHGDGRGVDRRDNTACALSL